MTATHEPHIDSRHSRPFAVVLRGGTTGAIVEHHRFYTAAQAWAFYLEHKA